MLASGEPGGEHAHLERKQAGFGAVARLHEIRLVNGRHDGLAKLQVVERWVQQIEPHLNDGADLVQQIHRQVTGLVQDGQQVRGGVLPPIRLVVLHRRRRGGSIGNDLPPDPVEVRHLTTGDRNPSFPGTTHRRCCGQGPPTPPVPIRCAGSGTGRSRCSRRSAFRDRSRPRARA